MSWSNVEEWSWSSSLSKWQLHAVMTKTSLQYCDCRERAVVAWDADQVYRRSNAYRCPEIAAVVSKWQLLATPKRLSLSGLGDLILLSSRASGSCGRR